MLVKHISMCLGATGVAITLIAASVAFAILSKKTPKDGSPPTTVDKAKSAESIVSHSLDTIDCKPSCLKRKMSYDGGKDDMFKKATGSSVDKRRRVAEESSKAPDGENEIKRVVSWGHVDYLEGQSNRHDILSAIDSVAKDVDGEEELEDSDDESIDDFINDEDEDEDEDEDQNEDEDEDDEEEEDEYETETNTEDDDEEYSEYSDDEVDEEDDMDEDEEEDVEHAPMTPTAPAHEGAKYAPLAPVKRGAGKVAMNSSTPRRLNFDMA